MNYLSKEDEIKIIKEAIELISVPERWTQNSNARDKNNISVSPYNNAAVCWCAGGAIYQSVNVDNINNKQYFFNKLLIAENIIGNINKFSIKNYREYLSRINDTLGREIVIEVLENYIEHVKLQLE